jgi:hypothetical protein
MFLKFPETTETFAPRDDKDALLASLPGFHCHDFAVTKFPSERSGA